MITADAPVDATVVGVRPLAPDLVRVTVSSESIRGLDIVAPTQWLRLYVPHGPDRCEWTGRPYTIRYHRPELGELDIDMVLHDHGPLGRWASRVQPGEVVRLGPVKGRFDFPEGLAWWLLVADPSAEPAARSILEHLPVGHHVTTLFQSSLSVADVRALGLPDGPGCAWVAGEASQVRQIHLHLAAAGLARHQLRTKGYWKRGHADLRA